MTEVHLAKIENARLKGSRHADLYPSVIEFYNRVKQVGLQKHLEEEEERVEAGIDLMGHLERRCCKVVKPQDK